MDFCRDAAILFHRGTNVQPNTIVLPLDGLAAIAVGHWHRQLTANEDLRLGAAHRGNAWTGKHLRFPLLD